MVVFADSNSMDPYSLNKLNESMLTDADQGQFNFNFVAVL